MTSWTFNNVFLFVVWNIVSKVMLYFSSLSPLRRSRNFHYNLIAKYHNKAVYHIQKLLGKEGYKNYISLLIKIYLDTNAYFPHKIHFIPIFSIEKKFFMHKHVPTWSGTPSKRGYSPLHTLFWFLFLFLFVWKLRLLLFLP